MSSLKPICFRYNRISLTSLLAVFLCWPATLLAQADWELRRDEMGVQVYTRSLEGYAYKQVRSVVSLENTRLSSIVSLILDTSQCSRWSFRCSEARVIERLGEQESYVYTVTDLPWPASDRDMISHATWVQDPQSLEVIIRGDAVADLLPAQDGLVRVRHAAISWRLTPRADASVQLDFTALIDPSGNLPVWITNQMLVETPFRSLIGIRDLANTSQFINATRPYISEPDATTRATGVPGNE
jgi:hypothetical protein